MPDETFVLVHSPVVGPRSWAPTARALGQRGRRAIVPALRLTEDAGGPYWAHFADQAVRAITSTAPAAEPPIEAPEAVVLVAHSAAGALLPVIQDRLRVEVRRCVFVDATVPARTGPTPVVPPQHLPFLRKLERGGRLPRWSDWWDEDAMATLVPDPRLRAHVEEEMPSLPLAWFEEAIPVPSGWPSSRCGYVHLSPPYDAEAANARSRGWPVTTLPGGHLHMLVDPDAVARAIVGLAAPQGAPG